MKPVTIEDAGEHKGYVEGTGEYEGQEVHIYVRHFPDTSADNEARNERWKASAFVPFGNSGVSWVWSAVSYLSEHDAMEELIADLEAMPFPAEYGE